MRLFKKARRELWVGLSKLCKKQATTNYMGKSLTFPLIYGMGRGYIIPAEFWMSECIRTFIATKQGCVIDVGANVGVYLVKLKTINPDVSYYGFEPNHVCNFYTQELIRLNEYKQATVFPFALSERQEVRMLYASARGDKTASLEADHKEGMDNKFSMNICTQNGDAFLGMLNISGISVVKIDVEGHELEVIKGIYKTLAEFRPYVYCEVLGFDEARNPDKQKRTAQVYELIARLNYTIYGANLKNHTLDEITRSEALGGDYKPEYMFVPNELKDEFLNEINTQLIKEN